MSARKYPIAMIAYACANIACAAAPQSEIDSVAVYSDICFHEESGDLLGDRFVLLRFPEAAYVVVHEAIGEVQPAQLAKAIISKNNSDITFTLFTSEGPPAVFKGKVTEKVLTGIFENGRKNNRTGSSMFSLPRIVGRQKGYPDCK
jgi:hypothetical protein